MPEVPQEPAGRVGVRSRSVFVAARALARPILTLPPVAPSPKGSKKVAGGQRSAAPGCGPRESTKAEGLAPERARSSRDVQGFQP